jgi:cytochrome c553
MKNSLSIFLLMLASSLLIACDSGNKSSSQVDDKKADLAPPAKIATEHEVTLVAGCSGCHGTDGVSSRPDTPFIAGQSAKYLEYAIRSYLITDRKHEVMRQAIFDVDVAERQELANYYSRLTTKWKGGSESQSAHAGQSAAPQTSQKNINSGQALSKPCSGCHGLDGNSIKVGVPSLAGLQPVYFVPAVKAYLSGKRKGAAIMKNFKLSLSNNDINNLAAFYAAQQRQLSPLSAASQKITPSDALTQRCLGCHGHDGNSTHPAMPSLAGQNATYLIKAMKKYRAGKRGNKMMTSVAKGLSDDDIERNATYFATRTPVQTSQTSSANTLPIFDPIGDGEKLAASCNGCHGNNGNNPNKGTPRLAGLSTQYLNDAISSYRDKKRNHPMMQMLAGFLSETDIEKLSLYYANQKPEKNGKNSKIGDATSGQELASSCSGCHGKDGNSQDSKIPSLAGQDAAYLVSAINSYKEGGTRNHSDMKGVAQELDIKAKLNLAQFYSEQSPTGEAPRALEGPDVLSKKCDRCHGENGGKPDPEKPRIAGQRQAYLSTALNAYKKGDRIHSTMQAMSSDLWSIEIDAIAAYYAGK